MIYLDSAATTPISQPVFEAMEPYLKGNFANPSSHYTIGYEASRAIDHAREIIAASINAKPSEIIFTSGGSEANNIAIKCATVDHRGSIVTSKIEHHSVSNACKQLKSWWGIDTMFADNDSDGLVTVEDIERACRWDTSICSVMMVNNEIGTIEPIAEIGEFCYDQYMIFHTDAVQAFGHIPIDVKKLRCDLLSCSGHKLHAPKGVGFLYVREGIGIEPLIIGGQQEHGLRAGTENVASIVGLGRATEIAMANMQSNRLHDRQLCELLLQRLAQIPECHVNCNISKTDYRHVNFRIDGIAAEVMLGLLDTQGICVSSGSACNSNSGQSSHVLQAIGLSEEAANQSLRISLGEHLSVNDIEMFIRFLASNIQLIKGDFAA